MGEAYRGLTIMFKADGSKVLSTMKTMTSAARQVESELRMVKRALKFDGSSTKAAQAQLKLLAEKAAATATTAERLRRTIEQMGNADIGGKSMKELSASTRDASTQASLLKARYSNVTEELARQYNQLRKLASETRGLKSLAKVFDSKDFVGHDIKEVEAAIGKMGKTLKWSAEETERWKAEIRGLRSEFKAADAAYKQMTDIAGFQSMGYKLEEEAAKQKAAIREMVAASKQLRMTGFEASIKDASAEVGRLDAQIKDLKASMRLDPKSFKLAALNAETARGKISALKSETEELEAEMRQLGETPGVKELASDFGRLHAKMKESTSELDRVGTKLANLKSQANGAAEELDEARLKMAKLGMTSEQIDKNQGIIDATNALKKMNSVIDETQKEYDVLTDKAQMYARAVRYGEDKSKIAMNQAAIASTQKALTSGSKTKFFSPSAFTSVGMQMYSTLYPAMMMGGQRAVEAARDVDAAYRAMRKTVQGTEEDFSHLKDAAIEFGNTHFTSADDILNIEAAGGQLGITVDNLEAFSKVVSDLSIATDDAFTTDDIALWMGKMSNIMHISADEYDNFADSLVRLGNSEPALESDIANITSRFASMASIVGMTPDQILAIATSASATGQKAEAAGGSLQRVLGRIEASVAGVTEGMLEMDGMTDEGIEELEAAKDKLSEYASVAGMSAEQFATAWRQKPAETFQAFINGLERMKNEGHSTFAEISKNLGIGSIRDQQLLSGLTQTTDVLAESLTMSAHAYQGISDEWGLVGDAAREADNKSQGFSGTLQILLNNAQSLGATMAESMTPGLKVLTGVIQDLVGWFNKLDPSTQTAMTSIIGASGMLGPVLTGIGAFGNMFGSVKSSISKYMSAENKLARVEGSTLHNVMGSAAAYRTMGEKAEQAAKKLDIARRAQSGVNTAQIKHIAQTGQESKAIKAQQAIATKNVQQAQREVAAQKMRNMGTRLGAGMLSAFGGLGQMALISAAGFGIEQLAEHVYDAWRKNEQYRESTDGLRQVTDRLKKSTDAASLGVGEYSKALGQGVHTTKELLDSADETTAKNAQLASSFTDTLDAAQGSAVMAQIYADKMMDLSGNVNGDKAKLEELKNAVKEYNNLTGDSVAVVDDFSGRLNSNTDAINANLAAFKERAMANAFYDVAQESSKAVATTEVEITKQERAIDDLISKRDKILNDHKGEASTYEGDNGMQMQTSWAAQAQDYQNQIDALVESKKALEEQQAAAQESADTAYEMAAASDQNAMAKQKEKEKIDKASKAVDAYKKALGSEGWESIVQNAGLAEDQVESFASDLSIVGMGTQQMVNMGVEQFNRLYNEAGGKLNLVNDAMNAINTYHIDPKDVSITDNGVEVLGHVINLDEMTIDGKTFRVNDDGSVETSEGKIDELKGKLDVLGRQNPTPTVSVNDNASGVINGIINKISQVKDKSITITTTYVKRGDGSTNFSDSQGFGHASGGISDSVLRRIPMNAAGRIDGIVTQATLTNRGIVGEAGDEAILNMGRSSAIVPLSNKRYVRPFARAVASEMPGGSRPTTVINKNYSVNGMTLSKGSDGARALEALFDALKIEEAS